MISLRLMVDTTAPEPFVVRLHSLEGCDPDASREFNRFEVGLQRVTTERAEYLGPLGHLGIRGIDPSEIDGDVLLVNPRRGTADRLIRKNSLHNTFLVTERCDQLCVMCSQPPKDHHTDLFPHFEAAALLAPDAATIGISGGEPTLFKEQLFAMLRRVTAQRPDLSFHILTNAQHFCEGDVDQLKVLSTRIVWGVPIYGQNSSIHDGIVGKPGAFAKLQDGLAILARSGAQIELRTVLMITNAYELSALARFVTTTVPFIQTWAIMQLENIGYGRMNWQTLFYDSSSGFEVIAEAVNFVRSRGIDVKLYNFPLCTVPDAYRHLAPSTISDWKRRYIDECDACKAKDRCGGFFEWHPRVHGYAKLAPL